MPADDGIQIDANDKDDDHHNGDDDDVDDDVVDCNAMKKGFDSV